MWFPQLVRARRSGAKTPMDHASSRLKAKRRSIMSERAQITSVVAIIAFVTIVAATMLVTSPRVHAQSDRANHADSRIERGFDIAPVPLKLEGKDRALVGLGSYLVNAVAACNDCHDAGPRTQFLPGENPFF